MPAKRGPFRLSGGWIVSAILHPGPDRQGRCPAPLALHPSGRQARSTRSSVEPRLGPPPRWLTPDPPGCHGRASSGSRCRLSRPRLGIAQGPRIKWPGIGSARLPSGLNPGVLHCPSLADAPSLIRPFYRCLEDGGPASARTGNAIDQRLTHPVPISPMTSLAPSQTPGRGRGVDPGGASLPRGERRLYAVRTQ